MLTIKYPIQRNMSDFPRPNLSVAMSSFNHVTFCFKGTSRKSRNKIEYTRRLFIQNFRMQCVLPE